MQKSTNVTTRYFCTLFDSNFLSRGLALHQSLTKHLTSFVLFVYCFDDLTYEVLTELALPSLRPVSMIEFEDAQLLTVKPSRSAGEYCWTCTPHIIRHAIKSYGLPAITYLDADLYFFESPAVLLEEWEMSDASVLITEHRYTQQFDQTKRFGIYCVQFMGFRADAFGMTALNWWAERCIEWCYARDEDGKFGDQKYLDDWTTRFHSVHVLQHLGGGVAPWNVQQYVVQADTDATVQMRELTTGIVFPLVFYHFHGLQIFQDGEIDLSTYPLGSDILASVYAQYLDGLRGAGAILERVSKISNFHGIRRRPVGMIEKLRRFKRRWQRQWSGALNVRQMTDLIHLR